MHITESLAALARRQDLIAELIEAVDSLEFWADRPHRHFADELPALLNRAIAEIERLERLNGTAP